MMDGWEKTSQNDWKRDIGAYHLLLTNDIPIWFIWYIMDDDNETLKQGRSYLLKYAKGNAYKAAVKLVRKGLSPDEHTQVCP